MATIIILCISGNDIITKKNNPHEKSRTEIELPKPTDNLFWQPTKKANSFRR